MSEIDDSPLPGGTLSLQTIAMPADTNAHGDIFGGWLVSQMDLAGMLAASREARGRVATVSIDGMSFMVPVKVGAVVSCYTEVSAVGRSSIEVTVEVWAYYVETDEQMKVTEGNFVFVAIDKNGRTRAVAQ
ncbi:MAG: acyl-CoA thioesterase [Pseudomonadales bacterium]